MAGITIYDRLHKFRFLIEFMLLTVCMTNVIYKYYYLININNIWEISKFQKWHEDSFGYRRLSNSSSIFDNNIWFFFWDDGCIHGMTNELCVPSSFLRVTSSFSFATCKSWAASQWRSRLAWNSPSTRVAFCSLTFNIDIGPWSWRLTSWHLTTQFSRMLH